MKIINVVIDRNNFKLQNSYSYIVDESQYKQLNFGAVVFVDFNNKNTLAYVIDKEEIIESCRPLKPIIKIIEKNVLTDVQKKIAKLMQEEYLSSYQMIMNLLIPKKIRKAYNEQLSNDTINFRTQIGYEIINEEIKITPRQKDVLDAIKIGVSTRIDIINLLGISSSVLETLVKKKIIRVIDEEYTYKINYKFDNKMMNTLTKQQDICYQKICQSTKPFLLHGVTASGKTEIYLKLIADVIEKEGQVLFLVPEKTLIMTFSARLKNIYGNNIAYVNNDTSSEQLFNYHQKIKNKTIKIVIATRSGIFLPFEQLDLIIVDEEHDQAYKNKTMPFYTIRDLVMVYYKSNQTKVVFGSATPSFESYARAKKDIYEYYYLDSRFGGVELPKIEIQEIYSHETIFSIQTLMIIKEELEKNKKVIILYNSRGHSRQVICNNCQMVYICPNCQVSMTYYKSNNKLYCNFCGYNRQFEKECMNCKSTDISFFGVGIEQVAENLEKFFPNKITLLDGKLARKKKYLHKVMNKLYSEESFILLGTQIITKGLDITDIDLVVVPNVDNAIYFSDLKAIERLYQLLVQVSGRAGRLSSKGRVIIQTTKPKYMLFNNIKNNEYESFYNNEMLRRKINRSIPYYNICQIIARHKDEQVAYDFLNDLILKIDVKDDYIISKVAKPYIAKTRNKYNYLLQIKYRKSNLAKELKKYQQSAIQQEVELIIDLKIEDNIL